MNGALSQVWGMINGLQLPVHYPALDVEFPESTEDGVEILLGVVTFDIPYVNLVDGLGSVIALPEDHDFTDDNSQLVENLDSLDFGSRLASANLGSVFIALLISPIIYGLTFLLGFIKKTTNNPSVHELHAWLEAKFMWNWLIRLTLETSLELTMSAVMALCVSFEERESSWIETADFIFSCFIIFWIFSYIVFVVYFYPQNSDILKYQVFKDVYGSTYEGLRPKVTSLGYPIIFIVRRALFVAAALLWSRFLWLQIMSQVVMTTLAAVYVVHFKPMEDVRAYRLEIFNEQTAMLALSLTICFSDLVPDNNKYNVGVLFNCLLVGNILTHMSFIVKSIIHNSRESCERKKVKTQSQESNSEHVRKFKEQRKNLRN